MTLLAALACGAVAAERAGRCRRRNAGGQPDASEIEELIGFFVNTLALRLDL